MALVIDGIKEVHLQQWLTLDKLAIAAPGDEDFFINQMTMLKQMEIELEEQSA